MARRRSLENILSLLRISPDIQAFRGLCSTAITSSIRQRRRDPLSQVLPLPPYNGQEHFKFEIIYESKKSAARVGRIHTPHGIINTPGFVAVATNAALKALDFTQADDAGLELAFCNTYHLMLHPGADVVEDAGGLHAFTGRRRDRPLITDSGGFQVFSLAYGTVHEELTSSLKRSASGGSKQIKSSDRSRTREGNLVVKISEDGVVFKSYRDGTRMLLSPESSVAAQKALGADIILPLDELPPYHIDQGTLAASVARSHRWEARSLRTHIEDLRKQAMYGIVHGGSDLDLRQASADFVSALPFDGVAVGGALGADHTELQHIMRNVMTWLPRHRPCHVLGIADPKSIPELVPLGCDTFDSCHATRVGRHGAMLTTNGNLRVGSGVYKSAHRPPVDECQCSTCQRYSLSYLHHLVKAREPLAASLLTVHNIHFMCRLMEKLRSKILDGAI